MTVRRCPLCDHGADSEDALIVHLTIDHADWDPEPRREPKPRQVPPGHSPSPGADPAYVAQLALWADEDPDMVRRYVGMLIGANAHPVLLAMPDRDFWQVWAAVGHLWRTGGDVRRFLADVTGETTRDDELDDIAGLMQPDTPCRAATRASNARPRPKHLPSHP